MIGGDPTPELYPPWWMAVAGIGIPAVLCALVGCATVLAAWGLAWFGVALARWCRTLGAVLLVLLLATPAQAGYRNLLIFLDTLPPDGFHPGATVPARITTTWQGHPLPHMMVQVQLYRPNSSYVATWFFRTDDAGERAVPVELLTADQPGSWWLGASLFDALPDGSYDGDGILVPVTP